MKTICYVDGYNLFYGCLKHSQDKWLDLYKLLYQQIIYPQNPKSQLVKIKFFTADIKAKIATHGQDANEAQQSYHRALEKCYPDTIEIIKGYYSLEKAELLAYQKPPDKQNRVEVWRLEEKQTDVNIAVHAYRDAIKGDAEQLVFVSNDTDLEPALSMIRQDMGDTVKMGVIFPIRQQEGLERRPPNGRLSKYTDWTRRYITDEELAASHLPLKIPTNKKTIFKPTYW